MAKSATYVEASASKDPKLKMDTVKEESVDDSAQETSHKGDDVSSEMMKSSSKATPARVESSMGSLPSDDQSVMDSVRSVEWKIDVKQGDVAASPPQKKQDLIKEEKNEDDVDMSEDPITEEVSPGSKKDMEDSDEEAYVQEEDEDVDDTSSDLNTRDEMADLESCPDNVGQSQSMSGNDQDMLMAQADAITDELLNLILEDYKADEEFDTNATQEQPDEDDYREKFPWTLDKKPEPKASPKPPGVKVGAPPKQPKTERELKDEAFKKKHDENM